MIGGLTAYPIDTASAIDDSATADSMLITIADYVVDVEASYAAGIFDLDFTLGTPAPATWAVYMILTTPSVQIIPLWSVSLPVLSPPITIPISFPYLSFGWAGIWTGLFTAEGAQAMDLAWIDLGYEGYAGPDGEALRYYLLPERLLELTENPDPNIWIIDVRPAAAYAAGHIPTAMSFPSSEIAFRLDELPLDVNLILYCETGGRVQNVIENVLEPNGYTRFMNWGGVTKWPYTLEVGTD